MGLDDVQLHFINNMDQVTMFNEWLSSRSHDDVISVDTETTGINKDTDRPRLIQFGDTKHGWAMPVSDWLGVAREAVSRYEGKYTGSNIVFDYNMLRHVGIILPQERCRDTRIATHICEPTLPSGLKHAAARHVDPRAGHSQKDLDEAMRQNKWTWATIPTSFQHYWFYGALDTVIATQLDEVVYPRVMSDAPKAYDIEMGIAWVTDRMERTGVCIDADYATKKHAGFIEHCAKIEKWCKSHYGVSPGSNKAIIAILERDGFVFTKATKSGAVALDKEVLATVKHPLANAVLERRQLLKIASTYLSHFINERDENDLIHPSINPLGMTRNENARGGKGVRTGRMSMSNPNLQNLPRRSGSNLAANVVRNCIVAREGHTLIMCDFDQIEMRCLAHVANELAMISAFKSEGDFFLNLASQIYGTTITDKKDTRRQVTKNAGYAKIYGAGVAKFAVTAGIDEEQARSFLMRFDELYPGVRRFQDAVQQMAYETHATEGMPYVRSPLTARRYVADLGKEYTLVNHMIQGMASELFKTKILELDAAGLGPWLIVPVHDEAILDVPNEFVPDVVNTLEGIMNDEKILSVPVTAGVSFAKRWGEKEDWDIDRWRKSI